MFVLLSIDIGNGRWTKSGFLTRLSNGGPPQVPGTHAGTRGVGEFDGIIAAVNEDETYYHRDQCDMITMILRLAAEPAWRYERGRQTTHTAGAAGRLEVRNPSHRSSLPLREGAVSSWRTGGSSGGVRHISSSTTNLRSRSSSLKRPFDACSDSGRN